MKVLATSAVVYLLDQLSKHWVRTRMEVTDSIPILGEFFQLAYVENSGIAFGINFPGGPPIFLVATLAASLAVAYSLWSVRGESLRLRLSLALILGGAIGNLTDRIARGKVVDFLSVGAGDYSFPVFNIADSAVTIGVGLFLWDAFRRGGGASKAASA